jgi:hypothetical protein
VLWIRIGFSADPDPDFYLHADPNPNSQTSAYPDPDPGQTLTSQKADAKCRYFVSLYITGTVEEGNFEDLFNL